LTHDPVHGTDILGKTTATGLKTRGNTHPLIYRTLRKNIVPAVVTLATWDVMENHHTVAALKGIDALTDCPNPPRSFMPETPAGRGRAGGNLLQVCAADAAGMHADQHFPGADLRDRNGLEADIVLPAIHCGLPVGGNWRDGLNLSFGGGLHQLLESETPVVP